MLTPASRPPLRRVSQAVLLIWLHCQTQTQGSEFGEHAHYQLEFCRGLTRMLQVPSRSGRARATSAESVPNLPQSGPMARIGMPQFDRIELGPTHAGVDKIWSDGRPSLATVFRMRLAKVRRSGAITDQRKLSPVQRIQPRASQRACCCAHGP